MLKLTFGVLSLLLSTLINAQEFVNAQSYQAFWLWSGVTPPALLNQAQDIYLLRAQIDPPKAPGKAVRVIAQSASNLKFNANNARIWLVFRVHTLDWQASTWRSLHAQIARWLQQGNPLHGIQIDFDARTHALNSYAEFLAKLRKELPSQYHLSITGLMDWSTQGDPQTLNKLANTVDELVIQTYQGHHTIENYQRYLPSLKRLTLPFRLGLIEQGQWQAPSFLKEQSNFLGYVVFLRNHPHK